MSAKALPYSTNVMPLVSVEIPGLPTCLEFAPPSMKTTPEAPTATGYFVVGTYALEEQAPKAELDTEDDEVKAKVPDLQNRSGTLLLYKVNTPDEPIKVQLVQEVKCKSAVLDLHFLPDTNIFATSSSSGTISFYAVEPVNVNNVGDLVSKVTSASPDNNEVSELPHKYQMVHVATRQVFSEATIITQFAWHPKPSLAKSAAIMTATTSVPTEQNQNCTYIVQFGLETPPFQCREKAADGVSNSDSIKLVEHGYDAWCCAWSAQADCVFSGGDDNHLYIAPVSQPRDLCGSEVRVSVADDVEWQYHAFTGHEAGVTALLVLEHTLCPRPLLLTGSYDEHVRLYDIHRDQPERPKKLRPLLEEKITEGGGVWRLKLMQKCPDVEETKWRILASCMHEGARIIEVAHSSNGSGAEWTMKVMAEMRQNHESMVYACEVQPGADLSSSKGWKQRRLCVSTSFYDRRLNVWEYDPTIELK